MPVDTPTLPSAVSPPNGAAELWRRCTLRMVRDVSLAVRPILDALSAFGYAEAEIFGVRLALEEALVNAIKHGHGGDPSKCVRLRYRVTDEQFVAEVEDEGCGFDPAGVPDPLDPANWERDSGRGLLLMRHHMSSVRHNAAGNCVTMIKRRGPA